MAELEVDVEAKVAEVGPPPIGTEVGTGVFGLDVSLSLYSSGSSTFAGP